MSAKDKFRWMGSISLSIHSVDQDLAEPLHGSVGPTSFHDGGRAQTFKAGTIHISQAHLTRWHYLVLEDATAKQSHQGNGPDAAERQQPSESHCRSMQQQRGEINTADCISQSSVT